jgi:hypothetical protein
VIPPSLLIHTPPLAAPTKILPGVVGSAATAVILPVALYGALAIGPPKFGKALFIGSGPMKFQVKAAAGAGSRFICATAAL